MKRATLSIVGLVVALTACSTAPSEPTDADPAVPVDADVAALPDGGGAADATPPDGGEAPAPSFASCGNGVCEPGETQACPDCPATPGSCGDGTCGFGETATSCPADCKPLLVGGQPLAALPDIGPGRYKNYVGGLYPGGANVLPADHLAAGLAQAALIRPLLPDGTPDAQSGKIVVLSVGMSNTTQEFCHHDGINNHQPASCMPWTLSGRARDDAEVDHRHVILVNGARGGMSAEYWTSTPRAHSVPGCGPVSNPGDTTIYPATPAGADEKLGVFGPSLVYDEEYDRINACNLKAAGLSFRQVQVAVVKLARADMTSTTLPDENADAYRLERDLGDVVRTLKARYPNLRQVFLSSRVWGGFSGSTTGEPYSFETGFAVKWLIEAQIEQRRNGGTPTVPSTAPGYPGDLDYATGVAPWIAWGGYLWANYGRPTSGDPSWFGDVGGALYAGSVASESFGSFTQTLTLPDANQGSYFVWCGAGTGAARAVTPGPTQAGDALRWCDSDFFTLTSTGARANAAGWASDFGQQDGTHATHDGEAKVGAKWLHFFKRSPVTSCWFLAGRSCL